MATRVLVEILDMLLIWDYRGTSAELEAWFKSLDSVPTLRSLRQLGSHFAPATSLWTSEYQKSVHYVLHAVEEDDTFLVSPAGPDAPSLHIPLNG